MKQKNFNPNKYNKLNNIRKKVLKDLNKKVLNIYYKTNQ